MNIHTLKENMRRFRTKNVLFEQQMTPEIETWWETNKFDPGWEESFRQFLNKHDAHKAVFGPGTDYDIEYPKPESEEPLNDFVKVAWYKLGTDVNYKKLFGNLAKRFKGVPPAGAAELVTPQKAKPRVTALAEIILHPYDKYNPKDPKAPIKIPGKKWVVKTVNVPHIKDGKEFPLMGRYAYYINNEKIGVGRDSQLNIYKGSIPFVDSAPIKILATWFHLSALDGTKGNDLNDVKKAFMRASKSAYGLLTSNSGQFVDGNFINGSMIGHYSMNKLKGFNPKGPLPN